MASSTIADSFSGSYAERESGIHAATGEDARLIAGLQAGRESDYELLIARFQQPVYNLALRLMTDEADAGDVAQEVFLKVFRSIHRFRGQSSLRTWIYRITVNEAHNRRRWMFRHQHNEVGLAAGADSEACGDCNLPDGLPSPFDRALSRERQTLIEQALARINPIFREAVVLRDIEDLNYDEIAEILNIHIGTVKSRIMRGREALRRELTGALHGGPAASPSLNPRTCE